MKIIIFLMLVALNITGCVNVGEQSTDTTEIIADETEVAIFDESLYIDEESTGDMEERIWISNCEDVKEILLSVDGVLDVEITPSEYAEYQKQGKVTIQITTELDFSKDLEPNIENLGAFESFEIEYIEGATE